MCQLRRMSGISGGLGPVVGIVSIREWNRHLCEDRHVMRRKDKKRERKKGTKIYAIRRHDGSLWTQKQPKSVMRIHILMKTYICMLWHSWAECEG